MEDNGPKLLRTSCKDPISSFGLFHKFSVESGGDHCIGLLEIGARGALHEVSTRTKINLEASDISKEEAWFPSAVLNIAECCLLPWPSQNRTTQLFSGGTRDLMIIQ